MARLDNYEYHFMLRAANIKATIEELKMPPQPMDEVELMVRKAMIKLLEELANKLWEQGMNSTKGFNRNRTLFEIKDASSNI